MSASPCGPRIGGFLERVSERLVALNLAMIVARSLSASGLSSPGSALITERIARCEVRRFRVISRITGCLVE